MGLTILAMHYCVMKAMFFDGEIQYNGFFVVLNIIISYVVSMVAIVFMPNDSDVVRQVVFSLCRTGDTFDALDLDCGCDILLG